MNICKSISANTISVDLQSDFKLLNIESYLIEHPSVLSNGEDSAEIDENNELSDVKAGRLYVKYTCPEKETRDAIVQVKNGNLTENDVTELNTYISNSNVDKRMGILVGKSMDDKVAENLDKHDSIMIIILGKYLDENKNIFVSADTYTGVIQLFCTLHSHGVCQQMQFIFNLMYVACQFFHVGSRAVSLRLKKFSDIYLKIVCQLHQPQYRYVGDATFHVGVGSERNVNVASHILLSQISGLAYLAYVVAQCLQVYHTPNILQPHIINSIV
jgi:hypothetical protein